MRAFAALVLALSCYSLQNVRDAGCDALCRYEDYTSGKADGRDCLCTKRKDFKEMRDRVVDLGTHDRSPYDVDPE
jgi:hypothetical protein